MSSLNSNLLSEAPIVDHGSVVVDLKTRGVFEYVKEGGGQMLRRGCLCSPY